MYVLFCIASPNFAGLPRILSALNYAYFLGFLSLGVTFVIATGGIDFSIGPVMFAKDVMKSASNLKELVISQTIGSNQQMPRMIRNRNAISLPLLFSAIIVSLL